MVWQSQRCDPAMAAGRVAACAHAAASAIMFAEHASCLSSPHPFLRLFFGVRVPLSPF